MQKLNENAGVGNVGTEFFGKNRLKYAIESGITSPEYANYVTQQEIIAKYDKKLAENKKDLLAISLTRVVFVKEYLVIRL